MKTHLRILWTLGICAIAVACQDRMVDPARRIVDPPPVDDANFSDITTPFGDSAFLDPAHAGTGSGPSISHSFHDIYHVRITWGDHTGAPSLMPIIDWTGGLNINGAGLLVLRELISFEPDQDSILPRNLAPALAWASTTSADIDGIAFDFYHPKNVVYIIEPSLNFRTAPSQFSIPLGALRNLDTVIWVDNIQSVHIRARLFDPAQCPHGILGGKWVRTSRLGGELMGEWKSVDDQMMGRLAGAWFNVDSSSGYFYGRWHDAAGRFQGYFKGRWHEEPDPRLCPICGGILGYFRGVFTDEQGVIRGELAGMYDEMFPSTNENEFVFRGEWRVRCRPQPLE